MVREGYQGLGQKFLLGSERGLPDAGACVEGDSHSARSMVVQAKGDRSVIPGFLSRSDLDPAQMVGLVRGFGSADDAGQGAFDGGYSDGFILVMSQP